MRFDICQSKVLLANHRKAQKVDGAFANIRYWRCIYLSYPKRLCYEISSRQIELRFAETKLRMMNNSTNALHLFGDNVTCIKNCSSVEAKDYGIVMKTSFGIIASLSFFGNLLLCLVIFMKRSMLNKPYNILICSLAVTDMLTGMLYVITTWPVLGEYFVLIENTVHCRNCSTVTAKTEINQ